MVPDGVVEELVRELLDRLRGSTLVWIQRVVSFVFTEESNHKNAINARITATDCHDTHRFLGQVQYFCVPNSRAV
jgi:hypothetical protein